MRTVYPLLKRGSLPTPAERVQDAPPPRSMDAMTAAGWLYISGMVLTPRAMSKALSFALISFVLHRPTRSVFGFQCRQIAMRG